MLVLNKILQTVKPYWKEILLFGGVMFVFFTWSWDHSQLIKAQNIAAARYEAQIKNDKKLYDEEKAKKDKLLKDYQDNLVKLQKDYDIAAAKLAARKKKREEDIVVLAQDNPTELANQIHNQFGFENVK